MARGWGKSEEDMEAEKEHAREAAERAAARPSREAAERLSRRRSLELSLARIEDLLGEDREPRPPQRARDGAGGADRAARADARASMKIATWNVNGIRAREAQMVEWVAREQPDVVCLQEIKAKPEQVPAALCNLGGYWCYWHGAGGYSGVGLHLREGPLPGGARLQPSRLRPRDPHRAGRRRRSRARLGLRAERRQGLSREDRVPDRPGALRHRACTRPAGGSCSAAT